MVQIVLQARAAEFDQGLLLCPKAEEMQGFLLNQGLLLGAHGVTDEGIAHPAVRALYVYAHWRGRYHACYGVRAMAQIEMHVGVFPERGLAMLSNHEGGLILDAILLLQGLA